MRYRIIKTHEHLVRDNDELFIPQVKMWYGWRNINEKYSVTFWPLAIIEPTNRYVYLSHAEHAIEMHRSGKQIKDEIVKYY